MVLLVTHRKLWRTTVSHADRELLFLHFILALAWVDGSFHADEREFLEGLIEHAPLDADARQLATSWLDNRPHDPNWAMLQHEPDLGHALVREALLLAMMDMNVTQAEMDFLDRLRQQVEMDQRTYYAIQQEVERELVQRMKQRNS